MEGYCNEMLRVFSVLENCLNFLVFFGDRASIRGGQREGLLNECGVGGERWRTAGQCVHFAIVYTLPLCTLCHCDNFAIVYTLASVYTLPCRRQGGVSSRLDFWQITCILKKGYWAQDGFDKEEHRNDQIEQKYDKEYLEDLKKNV